MFWKIQSKTKVVTDGQEFYSLEFRDLIEKMLTLDPNERISMEDIAAHPWI